jgi:hypothetical protein
MEGKVFVIYDSENFAPLPQQDGLYNQPRPARWIFETDQLFFNVLALMVVVTQFIACYGVYRFLVLL